MNERLNKYNKTKDILSYTSSTDLIKLMIKGIVGQGYGINSIIDVNDTKIFIKAIPMTKIDLENMYDTSNIHNLPMYYHYGVGSAGFGCWRELAFHIKASNWVINNKCPHFPILYHYRIIENINVATKLKKYKFNKSDFEYWDSNENIELYIKNRTNTNYFIVMCLEYFPLTLKDTNIIEENVYWYQKQILTIILFLKKHEVIHFDAHLGNILTDKKILILTDFGLVLDKSFSLSKQEILFFNRNINYDKATLISNISFPIFNYISEPNMLKMFEKKYNVDITNEKEIIYIVFDNLDEIGKKFNKNYIQILKKYKNIIVIYNIFLQQFVHSNNKKSIVFPNQQLSF